MNYHLGNLILSMILIAILIGLLICWRKPIAGLWKICKPRFVIVWDIAARNFWKILYTALAVAAFIILVKLAWFCADKAFSPRTAELKVVMPIPGIVDQERVGLDSYKATYELFNSHFSQLLVILGFFGAIFGVLIPAGAYLLQRQSLKDERERIKEDLKDERERMEKDFKAREDSIIEKATIAAREAKDNADKSLRLAEEAKSKLERAQKYNAINFGGAFFGIASSYYMLSSFCEQKLQDAPLQCTIRIIFLSVYYFADANEKSKCIEIAEIINDYVINLSAKLNNSPLNQMHIKTIKDCMGDDFYKFKELYNKYFETPLE